MDLKFIVIDPRHNWVNHQVQFTNDFDHGIHTNNIERLWRQMIRRVKRNVEIGSITDYINTFIFQSVVNNSSRYSTFMNMLSIVCIKKK